MTSIRLRPSRSFYVFSVLLVLTVVWLLLFDSGQVSDEPGPIFSLQVADIDTLVLHMKDGQLCVAVSEDGTWRLSGGVFDAGDEIDSRRMHKLLEAICEQQTIGVVPDSGPDRDRSQYGLADGQETRLILAGGQGREVLRLGRAQPLGDTCYAAGVGRNGVFLVSVELLRRLMQLPDSIVLVSLWQPFDISAIDTVAFGGRRGEHLILHASDDSWWLQPALFARPQVAARMADYERFYADRLRLVDGIQQWRAEENIVRALLIHLQRTDVADLDRLQLRAPTDTALFRVRVNSTGDSHRRSATFLAALGPDRDIVLRGGHGRPVFARGEAGKILRRQAADILAVSLLDRSARRADSLLVQSRGQPDLVGVRRKGRLRAREGGPSVLYDFYNGLAKLVDVQPILEVLPPSPDSPLAPERVSTITFFFESSDSRISFQVGRLAAGGAPAAWFPDTKKLLRISEELIITLNNTHYQLQQQVGQEP